MRRRVRNAAESSRGVHEARISIWEADGRSDSPPK